MSEKLKIPDFQGFSYIYAVYRKKITFGLYKNQNIQTEELLELHIFNSEKEYRAVFSTAKNHFIESITENLTEYYIDDKMMLYGTQLERIDDNKAAMKENGRTQIFDLPNIIPKLTFGNPSKFEEEPLKADDCLYVRNYYSFDKNNLLYLKGYRMMGITKGGAEIG